MPNLRFETQLDIADVAAENHAKRPSAETLRLWREMVRALELRAGATELSAESRARFEQHRARLRSMGQEQ